MFERKINDFNLKNTFENGQCFRFNAYEDGYLGVALNNVIFLRQDGDSFFIDGVNEHEFNEKFVQYFDLNRDYKKVTESFKSEENMAAAVEYGRGMRILRQDSWETLISFIISQNNNIGRIKGIIERLCIKCGSRLEYNDTIFYAFPTPEQLKDMKVQDYSLLGCGYRAEYLYETVKNILDGKTELEKISKMGYDNAREAFWRICRACPTVFILLCKRA